MVDSILAVSTAGRCGTTITEVTSRSFVVLAGDERHLDQLLVPFGAGAGGEFTGRCCRGIWPAMSVGITTWSLKVA